MDQNEIVNILLVEDNQDHATIVMRGLSKGKIVNQVTWVKNGQEALDYLFQKGAYADNASVSPPGLVLLDIKLPKVDGIEVLSRIKQTPHLKRIPVIMLTTSARDEEINRCYALGANSYITKPVDFSKFIEKVRNIELYWVLINQLPTELQENHEKSASRS